MGNLKNRVGKLEAATASNDGTSCLTEAELDDRIEKELNRLIDSAHGAHTRHLLTQREVNELKNAYAQASVTGQDESTFITAELEAALERVQR